MTHSNKLERLVNQTIISSTRKKEFAAKAFKKNKLLKRFELANYVNSLKRRHRKFGPFYFAFKKLGFFVEERGAQAMLYTATK